GLRASAFFKLEKYKDAVKDFKKWNFLPQSLQPDKLTFQYGKSLFMLKRYKESEGMFSIIEQKYPESEFLEETLFLWSKILKKNREQKLAGKKLLKIYQTGGKYKDRAYKELKKIYAVR
ncbi:tol-pal system YbgF family protein, partial [Candidatus Riflebacteria bacterium]